jgi:alkylation response protein AidB-like acyl-CoA dehydrogenase
LNSQLLARRDVDFLLHEWLDVAALCARPRFADHSRETFDAALDAYARIAVDCFAPHNRSNDIDEPRMIDGGVRVNPAIGPALRAFCEAGLMAGAHDYDLGGMQLPAAVERAGMCFLFAANVSTSAYAMLTIAAANLLLAHADAELKARYVSDMLQGRVLGTMCLSEPAAGSSLADIATRAVRQSDGRYRLYGNKMWISGGDHDLTGNIVHLVLAKVASGEGQVPGGTRSISLFLVPKLLPAPLGSPGVRNDVVVAGLNHKLGYRGTSNCLLNFGEGQFRPEGGAGALGYLVGQEGEGLACMFHMMNEARIGVGAGAAALGYAGYLRSLQYSRERRQGRLPRARRTEAASRPVPIIEHADVRRMLLAQKAYAEGGLALVLFCSRLVDELATAASQPERRDAQELLDLLTPIVKSWPSQWCLAANDLAIQVHGGYGYTRDFAVEQLWRDNRLNPIHEGTHGIQAIDLLGRKVGGEDGAAIECLTRRIVATLSGAREFAELAPLAERVGWGWNLVRDVTARLAREPDPTRRLANATAYLEAFGHAVVGWIWLEQACVAARVLAKAGALAESEAAFYQGKLQTARWYAAFELPRIPAWLAVLAPIDETVLTMRPEWF